MNFKIGQIFEKEYSPECAIWCNENNAYIEEIEAVEGKRQFKIVAIPEPTQAEINTQIQVQLTNAVQHHLDTKAQELNYDNCLSVCSYVDTGIQKFDDEGKAFRTWRSQVWAKGYEILDACLAGEREIPTAEELISELPELVITYSEVI